LLAPLCAMPEPCRHATGEAGVDFIMKNELQNQVQSFAST